MDSRDLEQPFRPDIDLPWYTAYLTSFTPSELAAEHTRLTKARDNWSIVLERYGCGLIMVRTAVVMLGVINAEIARRNKE